MTPEGPPAAWHEWIAPSNLLSLVRNTAPFLFDTPRPRGAGPLIARGAAPDGFLDILRAAEDLEPSALPLDEQRLEYFALCLACHHATVATYIPTDVDSKIRGLLWRRARDPQQLELMAEAGLQMNHWDLSRVSRRWLSIGDSGPVSGHNGEWLSVMAGAHGRALAVGLTRLAGSTAEAIDAELEREAAAFLGALAAPGLEIETLQLAMSITHNVGDLDQGISYWPAEGATLESRSRFGRLAHENAKPYRGTFQVAAGLYKELLAAEGHRHYPLRAVRALRQSSDLLLPLGPFLDGWGAVVGTHPALGLADRAEVLEALVRGCRKVAGQSGYYRAIAGFAQTAPKVFADTVAGLPAAARRELKDARFHRHLALSRVSFESPLRKRVSAVRAAAR